MMGVHDETISRQIVGRFGAVKVCHNFKIGNEDKFYEIAAGLNYFLGENGSYGNRAKISLDATYLPNGSPSAPGSDFRAAPNGHDEIVVRAQFQLWI